MNYLENSINSPPFNKKGFDTSSDISNDSKEKSKLKIAPKSIGVVNPPSLLNTNKVFSDKEANLKLYEINSDIYQKTSKEKSDHGFNFKLFFKIFSGITLLALLFAYLRKFK